MVGAGAPDDELPEKLREWLDRLISVLPRIVEMMAGASAFSISARTNVTITVAFGRSQPSSSDE
jgi:hypothetical protein